MRTAFREFLKPREDRFKPKDKRIQSFQRINKIDFSGNIYLSDKLSNTDMILIKRGDLVISGINVEKGALAVYEGEDDITATIHYSSYSFDQTKIDIDYLKWFLKSSTFLKLVKEQVPGGIKTEIKPKHLLPLEIDLPDLEDQKEIVKRFLNSEKEYSELNHEISHQQSLLKKLRQAILQEAVQGKLVLQDPKDEPASELLKRIISEKEKLIAEGKIRKDKPLPPIKDDEIPFELPNGWVWCRLGEVCEAIVDCPHSTPKYLEIDTGFYGIDTNCINMRGEITWLRNMSEEEYQRRVARLIPKENDIVYSREGTIGLATFIPKKAKICLGQRVMLFRSSILMNSEYLRLCLVEENYKERLLSKHRGMGAKHVNVKDIVSSVLPLPPYSEQQRIVTKINTLYSICDLLEKQIEENANYSELLLQAVLKEAFETKTVYKTPDPVYRMVAEKK